MDSSGNAYVTRWPNSTDFPTVNPLQSALGEIQFTAPSVTKINPTGSSLAYSTYFGGNGNAGDGGTGIAVDSAGNAGLAGATSSINFPGSIPCSHPSVAETATPSWRNSEPLAPKTEVPLSTATGDDCPAEGNCSTSATVNAGQTATYNLQISPVNGFNGTVGLSCDDALAKSTCSLSVSSVTMKRCGEFSVHCEREH